METNCIISKDLLEGILIRLGVGDLLRFRCVCKSWCALIDHPTFVRTHYHHQYAIHKAQGSVPIFISNNRNRSLENEDICYILSKKQGDDAVVNITVDLRCDAKFLDYSRCKVECVGAANGIICLYFTYNFGEESYGLWNPATRDLKIIPNASPYMYVVGFGFHKLSNDFKVVAILGDVKSTDEVIPYEIYSLSTNSWKKVPDLGYYLHPSNMDACVNDVYYWITSSMEEYEFSYHIVLLNLSTEVFKVLDPPQCGVVPARDYTFRSLILNDFVPAIGLYKECLALIFTRRTPNNKRIGKVDIWVATKFDDQDFGVPLEWQCVLIIEPFSRCNVGLCVRTSPMDGQILVLNRGKNDRWTDEWFLYNPETCTFKTLGIHCYDSDFNSFRYVESLFPLLKDGISHT